MSRETAERYIEVIKTVIRLKKKKGRGNRRTLTIKIFYTDSTILARRGQGEAR